jgi:hypothetical protein
MIYHSDHFYSPAVRKKELPPQCEEVESESAYDRSPPLGDEAKRESGLNVSPAKVLGPSPGPARLAQTHIPVLSLLLWAGFLLSVYRLF